MLNCNCATCVSFFSTPLLHSETPFLSSTGLLWNLSCLDSLKPELLKSALPVLIESVVSPYTTGLDRSENDAEAFFNTTGCLRSTRDHMIFAKGI